MAYNFLRGDRDQPFLLPPDPRDWLPADHLAWFVRDVVDQLDLGPFLREPSRVWCRLHKGCGSGWRAAVAV
jgi:hypothetical protein